MPYFVGVRNGGCAHLNIVADGNQQVVLARFDDAGFFIKKDLERPLESFVADLETLTFQTRLGSFLDKTQRVVQLVESLGEKLSLNPTEMKNALRAARLCKADLATRMVVEMTSLQGVMGRYYALQSGEEPAVAEAIFEHYLPRASQDRLPETRIGLVVGVADRLDSLIGLFAVGLAPTGTKDPFAQRRTALGLCQNLLAWKLSFDLRWGLQEAARNYAIEVKPADIEDCLNFIIGRLRGMLLEMGFSYDVVEAVLAEKGTDPYGALLGVQELTLWVSREDWSQILPAFSRCVRITRDEEEKFVVDTAQFEADAEKQLYSEILQAEQVAGESDRVEKVLNAFLPLVPVINQFFDAVLVMAEDDVHRKNRLALLQRVAALTDGVVDLSALEGF